MLGLSSMDSVLKVSTRRHFLHTSDSLYSWCVGFVLFLIILNDIGSEDFMCILLLFCHFAVGGYDLRASFMVVKHSPPGYIPSFYVFITKEAKRN